VFGVTVAIAMRVSRLCASFPVDLATRLSDLEEGVNRIEAEIRRSLSAIREEVGRTRDYEREMLKSLRQDVTSSVMMLAEGIRAAVVDLAMMQKERVASFEALLDHVKSDSATNAKNLREEARSTLARLGDAITRAINQLSGTQRERLESMTAEISRLRTGNEQRQEALRRALESKLAELRNQATTAASSFVEEIAGRIRTVADGLTQSVQQISEAQRERLDGFSRSIEGRLDAIQTEGSEKLEQIRLAIDGELRSARDLRIRDSVKRVSDSLDQLQKALGEMQSIATDARRS
jgi:DNA recombination protein RmuC